MAERVPPDGLAAWRAVLRTRAVVVDEVEQRFVEAGHIPFRWYDVLVAVSSAPGGHIRLRDLGAALVTSRSGITRLVDRLEAAGLLVRERCDDDRRGLNAKLTPAGRTALRRAWPDYAQVIRERFLRHVTAAEIAVIVGALEKVDAG